MKFQNCIIINFVRTDGRIDGRKDARTSQEYYAPSIFPKLGHKKSLKKV